MDHSLIEGLQCALADHCRPDQIRAIEAGADLEPLWRIVDELGFPDAFVAEAQGGVGLPLSAADTIGRTLGAAAFPLPLLETMVARALIAAAGHVAPAGRIVLTDALSTRDGGLCTGPVPGLRTARHLLLRHDGAWHLLPIDPDGVRPGAYRPRLSGALDAVQTAAARIRFDAPHPAATLLAPLQAALLAGSLGSVLDLSVRYASDRRQFGRPIAQFQAVQHHLAVLAGQAALARMASTLGFLGAAVDAPDRARGASAKVNVADAAREGLAAAHAVHGAIGITEAYPLGVHARLAQELRNATPTAGQCAIELGAALRVHGGDLLQFVREALPAA